MRGFDWLKKILKFDEKHENIEEFVKKEWS